MFSWDDCPTDEGELVWVEHTIRLLIPRRDIGNLEQELKKAVHYEGQSRCNLGKAVRCEGKDTYCDQTAIDTTDFPWGQHHYGLKEKEDKIYCPRCDGGEDQ
jgi:hypothetical protein